MASDSAIDPELFQKYIPLNALRPESRADLAKKAVIREYPGGEYLFRVGDNAREALYLLSGDVQLEDANGKVLGRLSGGQSVALHRLAHQSPRKVSAKCVGAARVLSVDAGLLDVMLTWDQTGSFEVAEISAEAEPAHDDWMAKLLQMRTFQLVPPANLQAMFMRMQEQTVEAGKTIVQQDADGDYFYVIMEGRCMVTREAPNQKPVRLAELGNGSCFGEEALISESKRNATVTALTHCRLMRLSKDDFRSLLNDPLARRISFQDAEAKVKAGSAIWLDVRLPSEYQNQALPGSLNIPLYMLRARLNVLKPEMTYIAVCDTGRRSSVAVFVLTQKGYDAYVLDKGLPPKAA